MAIWSDFMAAIFIIAVVLYFCLKISFYNYGRNQNVRNDFSGGTKFVLQLFVIISKWFELQANYKDKQISKYDLK